MQRAATHRQTARSAQNEKGDRKAALLCYEADACGCHRQIVAQRLSEKLGLKVEDL